MDNFFAFRGFFFINFYGGRMMNRKLNTFVVLTFFLFFTILFNVGTIEKADAACPSWTEASGFLNNMSLYGSITLNGADAMVGSTLAAFGPGGDSDIRAVGSIDEYGYFLTIQSTDDDTITFKLCDKATDTVYNVNESIVFDADTSLDQLLTAVSGTVTKYTITPNAGVNGSIEPATSVEVNENGSITFTITPDQGFEIEDVLVDGVSQGAKSTHEFTDVTENHTISATFKEVEPVQYTITPSAGDNGSIEPSTAITVNENDNTTFTITPNQGYVIDDVLVDGVSQGAKSSYEFVNVTKNHTISVSFKDVEPVTYALTPSAGDNGSINPSTVVTVNENGNATFTITPDQGYEIEDVTIDGVSQGAITSHEFTDVTQNHTISASFKIITGGCPSWTEASGFLNNMSLYGSITLDGADVMVGSTLAAFGPGGDSDIRAVGTIDEYGYFLTIQSTDDDTITFKLCDKATETVHDVNESIVFEPDISNEKNLTAGINDGYQITPDAGTNGSITPSAPYNVASGQDTELTITPDTGYMVKAVYINGALKAIYAGKLALTDVSSDMTIKVDFKPLPEYHSADYNVADHAINLSELLRVIQIYNYTGTYYCGESGVEDGFRPGAATSEDQKDCDMHTADYTHEVRHPGKRTYEVKPPDWSIDLDELMRVIQLYKASQYEVDATEEDGYKPVQ